MTASPIEVTYAGERWNAVLDESDSGFSQVRLERGSMRRWCAPEAVGLEVVDGVLKYTLPRDPVVSRLVDEGPPPLPAPALARTRVIAIAGPARSGKDTLYDALSEHSTVPCPKFRFADPLKSAARELWGLTEEQIEGAQKEEIDPRWGLTPRRIMQHLGAEHGRALCDHVHVTRLVETLCVFDSPDSWTREGPQFAVVTDLRYPNELDALQKLGAYTVWIERPGAPRRTDHASETALLGRLDEFDLRIYNRAGVGALQHWAQAILSVVSQPAGEA